MTTRAAALRFAGWGWRHADRPGWALRGVDLTVQPGERVLLLGPSGAGKSTLLAAAGGLLAGTESGDAEGRCLVDGRPPEQVRDRLGVVFQDPQSQLVMARAGDDVAFGLENRAVPAEQIWPRVEEAFGLVGFPYGRAHSTAALSGGEQQRLALAGVVALRPGLLLLDEPTANLDPAGAALVRTALQQVLSATGATLLLVEHRVADVLDLVDRVVVLEPGAGVLADGPPERIFGTEGDRLAAHGVWVPGRTPARRSAAAAPGRGLIATDQVTYRYPAADHDALSPVDCGVAAGEAVCLTGPSGSGKSTLALMLAGLARPARGHVRATSALGSDRRPPWRWPARDLVRRIGTVFQNPEHQFLTGRVADELAVGPLRSGVTGTAARARVGELLDRLQLAHLADANPFTLSGGEQRRLSVATALATGPRLLVLDEPTFGQDARTWAELVTLLAELRDEGAGLAVVTHDHALTQALADRELALEHGHLAAAAR